MHDLTDSHLQAAKRLLAQEIASAADEDWAHAVGRVYQILSDQLSPVIGIGGVRALLARCAKLNRAKYPCLGGIVPATASGEEDPPVALAIASALGALDRELGLEAAAALYATFFALLANFIGESLTWQILQRAFKDDGTAAEETK